MITRLTWTSIIHVRNRLSNFITHLVIQWNLNQNIASKIDGLTHWGWKTHICVSKLPIIWSDNSLSPGRRQAIIWTNAGILLLGPPRTTFNETLIKIHTFSFKKIPFKMSAGKWRPFWLGLNVLMQDCSISIANALFLKLYPSNWGTLIKLRCRVAVSNEKST